MEKAKKKTIEDYQELLKGWHPTKNGELKPGELTQGSGKKVWWQCEHKHEWEAVVHSRTSGRGCPYCAGKRLTLERTLSFRYPEVVKEWHPTKNGKITPDKTSYGTKRKVWWKCKNQHEWEAAISSRTRKGTNCPYCSGRNATPERSLALLKPELAKEWHPTKNLDISPYKVSTQSQKKVWWVCKNHHEWKAKVGSRTLGSGCPVCHASNKISFPELCIYFYICKIAPDAISQYPISNTRRSLDIFIPSINLAIEYDGAYFHKDSEKDLAKDKLIKQTMGDIQLIRVREFGCPDYQSSNPLVSFYFLDHNSNTMSEIIRQIVETVSVMSKSDSIPNINISRDQMAIYQLLDRLEVKNSLLERFPEVAKEWHPSKNGLLTPEQFPFGSNRKAWWLCASSHEWNAKIYSRTKGHGCPYCSGNYVSLKNSLVQYHPEVAAQFHPNKNAEITVDKLSVKSNKTVWWQCSHGNSWKATVNDRTKLGKLGNPSCEECTPVKYLIHGYPKIAEEFHPAKNGEIIVNNLPCGTNKKVWWQCKHGYYWEASVYSRTNSGILGHRYCSSCRTERKEQKTS
ncbi:zinc-ribbon domain-containing protein [Psychrobacillus sp. FSL H8-0510]|uniref:zinc-ribbon domain-containing protein n=1 Tax=Psychrobacillus sp. FSL H8-0510 TaxID=2921394 RepID=UPI0030F8F7B3